MRFLYAGAVGGGEEVQLGKFGRRYGVMEDYGCLWDWVKQN